LGEETELHCLALKDNGIKKQILVGLGKDIQKELSAISSKKYPSIFRVRGVGK
jgi:hypothetical protein